MMFYLDYPSGYRGFTPTSKACVSNPRLHNIRTGEEGATAGELAEGGADPLAAVSDFSIRQFGFVQEHYSGCIDPVSSTEGQTWVCNIGKGEERAKNGKILGVCEPSSSPTSDRIRHG